MELKEINIKYLTDVSCSEKRGNSEVKLMGFKIQKTEDKSNKKTIVIFPLFLVCQGKPLVSALKGGNACKIFD